ncbi:hypothetical protein FHG87_007276 [Trinorchestia longiramus]|nr:hypothetical protein FHG87_007276 [Trinorchestia longiramus]
MDTSPPHSPRPSSVRVTSPTINAKILLDVSSMTSQHQATANHNSRMSPAVSKIPQPISKVEAVKSTNHMPRIVGNGPVAMTSQPQQQSFGVHSTIVQPIITRGSSGLPTVVTVQGPVTQLTRTGVGKVVDIDPWGSRTELKGSINLWGSEGGRLRIYMVEAGFSHANAILTKQRNRLNLENRGDLRLKLTNFKPNINSLAAAHQAHPSH